MTTESWVEVAQLRRGLYRFLGGALLPPDEERIEALFAAAGYLDGMNIEAFPYYLQWNALLGVLEELPEDASLDGEYIRLFASGVDRTLCPPIESFYRGGAEGGDSARVTADVQRHTLSLGLSTTGAAEAPDHISSELEVMSALCAREATGWTGGVMADVEAAMRDQHRFLLTHLAVWLPSFAARVRDATGGEGVYGALVDFCHGYVVNDVSYVEATRAHLWGTT